MNSLTKDGDKKAFEKLYCEYRDKLYFFVKKNVENTEAAEDIVSETFTSAMEKISSLKSEEAFGSWLYSIAYNKSMTYLKQNSRYTHFESEEEQESVMEIAGLNDPVELPDDYAVNKQRQEELKQIINDLKPGQRSAIMLYYFDQLSVSEVAKSLGISETNAKNKLFAARKKIKQGIEKLYKDGVVFSFVPMSSMLDSVMDRKSIAAARASSAPAAATASGTGKIVGTVAVLAVSAVAGISLMISNNNEKQHAHGDVRPIVNTIADSSASVYEKTASSRAKSKNETTRSDSSYEVNKTESAAEYAAQPAEDKDTDISSSVAEETVPAVEETPDVKPTASEGAEVPEEVKRFENAADYSELLDWYYDEISTQWSDYDHNRTSYGVARAEDGDDAVSYLWYRTESVDLANIGYQLIDINHDGTDELILGGTAYDNKTEIFDIYTVYNGEIVRVASGGERTHFSVGDNVIEESVSGSAGVSSYVRYHLTDGKAVPFEAYEYNVIEDPVNPYFYSDEPVVTETGGYEFQNRRNITEEEWQQRNNFEIYDVDLKTFSKGPTN